MIINETYDDFKTRVLYNPIDKEYKYLSALDYSFSQGDTYSITIPISIVETGSTIKFYSNGGDSLQLEKDIEVSDVLTINLTSEDTMKFQSGILGCNIFQNGINNKYLIGEIYKTP
jgi:hypothetical protein